MTNKRVTLSVDAKIYNGYKKYGDKNGLIKSKQFENLMRDELKKRG
jgi:phosphomannomutase